MLARRERWAAGVFLALAVAVFSPAYAGPSAIASGAPETVHLLDVPYVPQTEALCGGAAISMVLRYWGEPLVVAEDFTTLLEPGGSGISSDSLVAAARGRGFTALQFTGSAPELQAHLAQGRPVIALIQVRPGAFHYVVLLAWANGGVILHDPAVAPFRTRREADFDEAWAGGGHWALLILPGPGMGNEGQPGIASADSSSRRALTGCDAIVDDAIARARDGDTSGAEQRLLSAESLCPESAAPVRGLAGLRFAAKDWAGAITLAERALVLDPGDAYTWRLLAGSRFLMHDEAGALRAWNRVSEPNADLTRVDGLSRTRYRAVSDQLDLPPGKMLTAEGLVRARRRLAEIPAQSKARLTFTPLPHGKAQLNASLLERPLLFSGPLDAGATAARALVTREVSLRAGSPTGNGELWMVRYGWRQERPRAALALAIPAPGGHPGVVHVEGSWERQAYATGEPEVVAGVTLQSVEREERRRSALSVSDWITSSLRLEVGSALDTWSGRGSHVSVEGTMEARWADDRLTLGAQVAHWTSLESGSPFGTGGLSARWNTREIEAGGWRVRAAVATVTSRAPLSLWPGAGTGGARKFLLRAHPLLTDGVLTGRAFGRSLVSAGIERQAWIGEFRMVRLGWVLFVDGARPYEPLRSESVPWQTDAGVGLRIVGWASGGEFRITATHGIEDGANAISFGLEVR